MSARVREEVRDATAALLRSRGIWVLQFFGNIALFLWFSAWLQVPEAQVWQLIFSVLCALGFIAAAVALHGGTLVWYAPPRSEGRLHPFRRALRNIVPLLLWAGFFYLLWTQLDRMDDVRDVWSAWLRSEMPRWLREHIRVETIASAVGLVSFELHWIALPGLLLPVAQQIAIRGIHCFNVEARRSMLWAWSATSFWMALTIASVVGVWAPLALIDLARHTASGSFAVETVSLGVRLLAGYILAIAALLLLVAVMGRATEPTVAVD
jgi:hypothetical protein